MTMRLWNLPHGQWSNGQDFGHGHGQKMTLATYTTEISLWPWSNGNLTMENLDFGHGHGQHAGRPECRYMYVA